MMSEVKATESKTTTSQQEARVKLRKSFLRAVTELIGEECNILTFVQSVLQANFCRWNLEDHEFLVRDVVTPAGLIMPAALIRTPDVLALQFNKHLL